MTIKEKEKLQECQIKILEEIKRICNKNNINFYLTGGTCLGAVRHDGFIPWDDDVDIGMMRKDYEKFLKVCKNDLKKEFYLQTVDTDKDYPHLFSKIRLNNTLLQEKLNEGKNMHQGIFVDVFPYDYGSNYLFINKIREIKSVFLREAYMYKLGYKVNTKTVMQKLMLILIKLHACIHKENTLKKNMIKYVKKISKEKTKYICNYVGFALFHDIYEADIFDEYIEHKFENKKYNIFKKYDKYLTGQYGDYMTPPPKKDQEIGHGVTKIVFDTKKKN